MQVKLQLQSMQVLIHASKIILINTNSNIFYLDWICPEMNTLTIKLFTAGFFSWGFPKYKPLLLL